MTDNEMVEEMVDSIQNGHTELLPILWDEVARVSAGAIRKTWKSSEGLKARAKAHGLELEDLLQEGYFAFITAIEQHDTTKAWSFKTRLWICSVDRVLKLTKQRAGDRNVSAEQGIAGDDGELTLSNTFQDENAAKSFGDVEQSDYWARCHEDMDRCVDELPVDMASLIRWCYFDEKSAKEWAQNAGVSEYAAGRLRKKALGLLAEDQRLQEYRQDIIERYSYRGQVEQAVIKLDELDHRKARETIEKSWKAALLDTIGG